MPLFQLYEHDHQGYVQFLQGRHLQRVPWNTYINSQKKVDLLYLILLSLQDMITSIHNPLGCHQWSTATRTHLTKQHLLCHLQRFDKLSFSVVRLIPVMQLNNIMYAPSWSVNSFKQAILFFNKTLFVHLTLNCLISKLLKKPTLPQLSQNLQTMPTYHPPESKRRRVRFFWFGKCPLTHTTRFWNALPFYLHLYLAAREYYNQNHTELERACSVASSKFSLIKPLFTTNICPWLKLSHSYVFLAINAILRLTNAIHIYHTLRF